MTRMALSTATTREPKQMDPRDVVIARFTAPITGFWGLATNHHEPTVPAVVQCTMFLITSKPQKNEMSMKNSQM